MRYPVLNYPADWYIPQGGEFGAWRSDGKYYHEALDINLKTGGDSDIGKPVLAIFDGEVVAVHYHSTIPTFGYHVWIKHESNLGTVWSHSCHMQNVLVREGDKVKENQQIGEIGKTGTTVGHLHFAIAKKLPSSYDFVAKTQAQLNEYFVDPSILIEQWKNATTKQPEPMNKYVKKLTDFRSSEQVLKDKGLADGVNLDNEGEVDAVVGLMNEYPNLKRDLDNVRKELGDRMTDLDNANKKLIKKDEEIDTVKEERDHQKELLDKEIKDVKGFLNRTTNKLSMPKPEDRDFELNDVEKEISNLLTKEDEREELLSLWKKIAGSRESYSLQLEVIKNFIQDYQTTPSKDELLKSRKERIEELEKENETLRNAKPSYILKFGKWFIWFVKQVNTPKT